jgi:hypothetical protein
MPSSDVISDTNPHYKLLVSLHRARHMTRGTERVLSEVKDYLIRAAGLPPDARTAETGGLAGVSRRVARDAYMLASRSLTDITDLYPR